jgi:soluble lytic murein transglycosylase-like protein
MNENLYDSLFIKYGILRSIDPLLLKAQVKQESAFNPLAVSKCGAKGLAQFMPATWAQVGKGDIFNPDSNIRAQAAYMSALMREFKGDTEKVLAAYNWGMGNVLKLKVFALLYLPEETHHYVLNIEKYYDEYKKGSV